MRLASEITEKLCKGQDTFVKTTPCWEFTKKLFLENCQPSATVCVCYLIDPNGSNTVSVNINEDLGQEIPTKFSKKEIFDIKSIAEVNGLHVSTFSSDDENDFLFLEITYTAPNRGYSNY